VYANNGSVPSGASYAVAVIPILCLSVNQERQFSNLARLCILIQGTVRNSGPYKLMNGLQSWGKRTIQGTVRNSGPYKLMNGLQ
jgi:hypothetical protein